MQILACQLSSTRLPSSRSTRFRSRPNTVHWHTVSLKPSILEPEAKILMDAQEKEIDRYEKNHKNRDADVDDDLGEDINVEGMKLQDSFEGDDDVCIRRSIFKNLKFCQMC